MYEQLSKKQAERFRENCQRVTLHARTSVLAGRAVGVEIQSAARITHPVWTSGRLLEVRLDGTAVPLEGPRWEYMREYGDERTSAVSLPPAAPGRHRIECDVDLYLNRLDVKARRFDPLGFATKTLSVEFEVVSHIPDGYIQMVRPAEFEDELAGLFSAQGFHVSNDASGWRLYPVLRGTVVLSAPLPIGVAFEVIVVYGDRRVPLGRLAERAGIGRSREFRKFKVEIPYDLPERVDILLKPSLDVALDTASLREIWGGKVWLRDVTVRNAENLESMRRQFAELNERRKQIAERQSRPGQSKVRGAQREEAASSQSTSSQPAASQPPGEQP
jgi:hypothetical protein